MKFYTKIPKHSSSVSHTSSLTGEYQEYLKHGFVYDKLPAYKPKRGQKTSREKTGDMSGLGNSIPQKAVRKLPAPENAFM